MAQTIGNMEFVIDERQFQQLQTFADKWRVDAHSQANQAMVWALNETARRGLTQSRRTLSKNLGIKQAEFNRPHRWGARGSESTGKALRVVTAKANSLFAAIWFSGRRIPLVWFKPREVSGGLFEHRRRSPNVKWRGRPRRVDAKWMQRKPAGGITYTMGVQGQRTIKDAFFGRAVRGKSAEAANGASGHIAVYTRTSRPRKRDRGRDPKYDNALHQPMGPSIPQAASKSPELASYFNTELPRLLEQRLAHHIKRLFPKGVP